MIRSQLLAVAVTSMCVVACGSARDPGGGGRDGGGFPGSHDVHGRVVGPTGVALSGLSVGIGETTAVTDADGRFSIPGVVPPYDVNVVLAETRLYVGRYEGLTRPDPTLTFLLSTAPVSRTPRPSPAPSPGERRSGATGCSRPPSSPPPTSGSTSPPSASPPGTIRSPSPSPGSARRQSPEPSTSCSSPRRGPATHRPPTPATGRTPRSRSPAMGPHRRGRRPHCARERDHRRDHRPARRLPGAREDARAGGLRADRHPARPRGHRRHGVHLHRPGGNSGDGRSDGQRRSATEPGAPPAGSPASPPEAPGSPFPYRRPRSSSLRTTGSSVDAGTDFTWNPLEHAVHLLMLNGGPDEPLSTSSPARPASRLPDLPSGLDVPLVRRRDRPVRRHRRLHRRPEPLPGPRGLLPDDQRDAQLRRPVILRDVSAGTGRWRPSAGSPCRSGTGCR